MMKRSGSTRVARKIGSYDDDESTAESANNSQSEVQKPTGKSPMIAIASLSDVGETHSESLQADLKAGDSGGFVLTGLVVVKRPTIGKAKKRSSMRVS